MNECQICVVSFNRSSRAPVTCPHCSKVACAECCKQFILDRPMPICMHCNHLWTRIDLHQTGLPLTFINNELAERYKQTLLDQARGEIPRIAQIKARLDQLVEKEFLLVKEIDECTFYLTQLRMNKVPGKTKEKAEMRSKLSTLKRERSREWFISRQNLESFFHSRQHLGPDEAPVEERKRVCPLDECKGIISSEETGRNICTQCQRWICVKCQKERGDEHSCSPEDIETVKLLQNNTRPCPRCAVPIFRIEGCAQMFCTRCHTAFDWNRGTIIYGHIHNPHFFDWLEEEGRDVEEYLREEFGGRRGGLHDIRFFRLQDVCDQLGMDENILWKIYRDIGHYGDRDAPLDNEIERDKILLSWLAGASDSMTQDSLYRLDKNVEKFAAQRDLCQILMLQGSQELHALQFCDSLDKFNESLTRLEKIRTTYNERCDLLTKVFNSHIFRKIVRSWLP